VAAIDVGALALAFLITVVELTEVVALVFALHGETETVRHGALGAVLGVAVVGAVAVLGGSLILRLPSRDLLVASAVVLAAFGVFLFRSTLKSYRRARAARSGAPSASPGARSIQFAGGFTVGVVETMEAVIVLLPIAAAGQTVAAVAGAVSAGVLLVVLALAIHEQIRRIKVPWLKWGATSLLFSFAVFWAGEAVGLAWPYGDLTLVGLFVVALGIVRLALAAVLRGDSASRTGSPPR
jgi:uncharacterized membrane protein